MARFLKGRVSKLETCNRPPARVRHTVLTFNALTGEVIGPKPKGPCMIVKDHGTDDEWQAALLAQQARLIHEASQTIAEEEGNRHNA